jgi:hypothetical protein
MNHEIDLIEKAAVRNRLLSLINPNTSIKKAELTPWLFEFTFPIHLLAYLLSQIKFKRFLKLVF